uniref:Putative plant transposon protein domain-containing protein n=1 Tax=Solanum tuberosum TaxID=4113 RepID=M1DGX5_SOLTU
MAGLNEDNLPFVRFLDAASRERQHDNINIGFYYERGVDIPLNATTINEVLELPEVLNVEYEAKLREMDTLIEPARWDQVYWATVEGITSSDWSPDAKRWLHLETRRIRPSDNRTDVTFPRAMVVA